MDANIQAAAAKLVRRLKEGNHSLTLAESCTGGLLASTLTDIAGASTWFKKSWVTYANDAKVKELIDDTHLHNWLDMARERIAFQGLPARICWVGLGVRHRLGLAFNEMVRTGELSAPVVIGRDHLDSGSVASPNRETESMKDGSDAVSDWPLLNALLNTASGATWVSLHHGGGVGMGFSQHSGMVICCDGTEDADRRIANVLWNDPATGVMRHADAGYDDALACAREQGLNLPGILDRA